MKSFEAVATSSGPPEVVWELLASAPAWARWGPWSTAKIEGGGQQAPGKVRVLVKFPFRVRERITEWVPGERLGYELIDGMHVRGYRATIALQETADGGTTVRWRGTYDRSDPFTALVLRLAIRDACKRLAKAAAT